MHGGASVSSKGRFRKRNGVVTTPAPEASGYVRVKIDGKHYSVHRLVATAFLGPVADGIEVNHISVRDHTWPYCIAPPPVSVDKEGGIVDASKININPNPTNTRVFPFLGAMSPNPTVVMVVMRK